jgi:hypothetical protein
MASYNPLLRNVLTSTRHLAKLATQPAKPAKLANPGGGL